MLEILRNLLGKAYPKPPPLTPEAQELFKRASEELFKKQDVLKTEWGFGNEENWGMDQAERILRLRFADGSVVEADAQAIGSLSSRKFSWEWAWNNPHVDKTLKQAVSAVAEHGKRDGIPHLTIGILNAKDTSLPMQLCAVAVKIMDSQGVYVGSMGPTTFYLSVTNLRKKTT